MVSMREKTYFIYVLKCTPVSKLKTHRDHFFLLLYSNVIRKLCLLFLGCCLNVTFTDIWWSESEKKKSLFYP